ncbi:hypothetical protein ACQ9ZF_05195 [Cetobacterium somerae]|uniref:hypothetical protein n=1 Tax=Cetobacterium somerae TaxID=188913 RepID=UPI003D76799E
MKKLLLIVGIILICSSCSGNKKRINGIDQTFSEYVIFNKNYNGKGEVYDARVLAATSSEMFPGLRLKKWLESE